MKRYHDILILSRPRSSRHAPMPRQNRAAQFAPFAALSGYDSAIAETARLTEHERTPDEERLTLLNEKFHALLDLIRDQPEITITYFEPDERKDGGAYLRITGRIRRIDDANRLLIFDDHTCVAMDSVCEMDCLLLPPEADAQQNVIVSGFHS